MKRVFPLGLFILLVMLAVLSISHPALAWWPFHHFHHLPHHPHDPLIPVDAPELEPRLAIEGLAIAGAVAALVWERARRRR